MKGIKRKEIGIFVGGNSTEFDASILSYENVIENCNMSDSGIEIKKVFFISENKLIIHETIPKSEAELKNGVLINLSQLPLELEKIDYFLLSLLHGNEGEDGSVQGLADIYNLRGSFGSVFSACVSMNKWAMADLVDALTLQEIKKIPYVKIRENFSEKEINEFISKEECFILKPNRLGASLFTKKIKKNDVLNEINKLKIKGLFEYDNDFLLQRYIQGREFTVGVIEKSGELVVLPIVEIFTKNNFLGHEEKHKKNMVSVTFDQVEGDLKKRLIYFSKYIFKEFDFSNFCRFDFLYKDGNIYFLEANSVPGLMKSSIFPKMLDKAGISVCNMIHYFIENSQKKKSLLKKYRYTIED